jgi:alpha-tubulin suppressor-like RCC1 family protein
MTTSTTALGNLRFQIQGAYSASVVYNADDIVFYNGSWWRCTATTTAGILPTNASYFAVWSQGFNWRGTWVGTTGTSYALYDTVSYTSTVTNTTITSYSRSETETYICIAAHTSDGTNTYLPLNSTYWAPLVIQNNKPSSTITYSTATSLDNYGVYGQDPRKIVKFANGGLVGESKNSTTNPYYSKGNYKITTDSYNSMHWITADGGVSFVGADTNGSSGTGADEGSGPASSQLTFFFHDWFRSTSNGGSGVHSTPDNNIPRCIQLESGYGWGKALFNNGEVYAWGYNGHYEIGDATTSQRNQPVRCGGTYTNVALATNTSVHTLLNTKIVRISCAGGAGKPSNVTHHTLALDSSGGVWAWGYNAYGQCGNGNTTNVQQPTLIAQSNFGGNPVVAIWAFGADYGYSYALTSTNQLYGWGYNNYGQLGTGTTSTAISTPTLLNGQTWTTTGVGTIQKITSIASPATTGAASTAILTSKGQVFVAGLQTTGQFMINSTAQTNSWTRCTSGPGSSAGNGAANVWLYGDPANGCMMVRDSTDGTTWVAGYNGQYMLGEGTSTNSSIAVKARVRSRAQTYDLLNVADLACQSGGTYQSVMVYTDNGIVYGIGYNGNGQLGTGWTGTWSYSAPGAGNSYEDEASQAYWIPARLPPSMMGKVNGIMSGGVKNNAANNYGQFWISSTTGRLMVVGNGGSVNGYPLGQVGYAWGWSEGNHDISIFRAVLQD